ncbi:type IV toxin-antitoxin system AbiEi family antitoxin domain-containing protein [Cellulomonas sp. Sa3CUA2]|uniref:Type IV toxin-antitoxin system AbiEi family antitoxin domain-containing protein n=1 Tax=Cellulomonas avistercoris TaxID=2762242 RepID=A0ABR8Q9S7_9CELL|nr:type IV toxin-antitoxin system AbiEi family antitoxin domain-containing protein [Cellulomonas avistercoris]MBD7917176.1 type IV toxin-antitoxin system AbiEi family antitoxin domain-containing protein [Cellulomonas avistercoris]
MDRTAALPPHAFTLEEAAAAGVNARAVQRLAADGRLERLGRGLYQRPETAGYDTDLYAAATRAPDATLCLMSALAHHALVDAIPGRIDLALPRGTRRPAVVDTVRWHMFDAATFTLGRTTTPIAGTDATVGLYSAERSIVDAFRLRGEIGYETGIDALRTWLRRRGSSPAALRSIARTLPRAQGPLREALNYLT